MEYNLKGGRLRNLRVLNELSKLQDQIVSNLTNICSLVALQHGSTRLKSHLYYTNETLT